MISFEWRNEAQTILAKVDGNHSVIIEPGNDEWAELSARDDIAPFIDATPQPDPISTFTAAIDAHVEATARSRGYNSAAAAATYAESTVAAWQAEARAFIAWRDAVWVQAFAAMDAVMAGQAPPESPEAFIAGLPEIIWP